MTRGDCAEIEPEDLVILLPILDAHAPRVIVEIGTYYGGSARLWHTRYNPEILITMDVEKRAPLDFCYQLSGLPSQSPVVVEQVRALLNGRRVDLLFIDGDHRYPLARADFDLYAPFVRPGGLIVLHDILYRNDANDVPTLWKELKREYSYIEIGQGYNTTGVGIITQALPFERSHYGNVT